MYFLAFWAIWFVAGWYTVWLSWRYNLRLAETRDDGKWIGNKYHKNIRQIPWNSADDQRRYAFLQAAVFPLWWIMLFINSNAQFMDFFTMYIGIDRFISEAKKAKQLDEEKEAEMLALEEEKVRELKLLG